METVGNTVTKEGPGAFERERDTGTIRYFEEIGVSSGWRCLEVGGGGGTIAEWLCQRVGTAGHVVATDLDTRLLEAILSPNIEVRRHDIVNDELEINRRIWFGCRWPIRGSNRNWGCSPPTAHQSLDF